MTSQAVIAYAIGVPAYVMVKALAPNFFARGDTKTPVKYSMIVLLANLSFAVILMKPFGHVGIATATTIAAFVSLYQYLRGLKKRCFWKFTKPLGIKTIKIIIASLIMGASLQSAQFALNLAYTDWLQLALSPKIGIFTLLCILGVATFTFAAKILGILDAREIIRNIFKKGKKAC